MTNLRADVFRYDAIDSNLLSRDRLILEIGARHGEAQLASRHREAFLSANRQGRYCGIDVIDSECDQLRILKGDFLSVADDKLGGPYDTIIMCEVAEHICLRDWPRLFAKAKQLLSKNGSLILTVPYRERIEKFPIYLKSFPLERYGGHVVYGIGPELPEQFLPGLEWKRIRLRNQFKTANESWLWAFGRLVKRIVTRHPLAWRWLYLDVDALMVVWTKWEG